MAGEGATRTVTLMTRLARTAELMRIAPHVYGAALAASRDERAAAQVTEGVLLKAAAEYVIDRDRLVERAILMGVRSDPAAAFAGMDPVARETVALARLAGYSVGQIAKCLGIGSDLVKQSMLSALRGELARVAS
jgi:DNA-directed RNA polymerase specialized sigma24 family protein